MKLARRFQRRVGGGAYVRMDALEVAQDVEMQRTGLDALDPPHAAFEEKLRFGVAALATPLMLNGTLLYLHAIARSG